MCVVWQNDGHTRLESSTVTSTSVRLDQAAYMRTLHHKHSECKTNTVSNPLGLLKTQRDTLLVASTIVHERLSEPREEDLVNEWSGGVEGICPKQLGRHCGGTCIPFQYVPAKNFSTPADQNWRQNTLWRALTSDGSVVGVNAAALSGAAASRPASASWTSSASSAFSSARGFCDDRDVLRVTSPALLFDDVYPGSNEKVGRSPGEHRFKNASSTRFVMCPVRRSSGKDQKSGRGGREHEIPYTTSDSRSDNAYHRLAVGGRSQQTARDPTTRKAI